MATLVTARRTFDYQMATGAVVVAMALAFLVPPLGGRQNLGLSVTAVVATLLVMSRPLGGRVRFTDSEVEFVTVLGRVTGRWPLDGTSTVSVDAVVTQSRWGRAVRSSLVIKGRGGMALALTQGRYTKERVWSELLLEHGRQGRLRLTEDARAALALNVAS